MREILPSLSIIIVNWNGVNFLPNCLRSIVENPASVPFEILVVDNESGDGSTEWMRSTEAEAILGGLPFSLIESGENLGFGRANNLAFEQTDSPSVLLLNPDTTVRAGAIDRLYETLWSNAKIGAVAPALVGEDGSPQANAWDFPPTPFKLVKNLIRPEPYRQITKPDRVKIVSGAAIMAKREMIEEVGGFDPDFHMYGEDAEWCARIGRSKWEIFLEPRAFVVHVGGQSSLQKWGREATRLREEEGFISFQRKSLPRYHVIANLMTRSLMLSLVLVGGVVRGRSIAPTWTILKLQLITLSKIVSGNERVGSN